MRGADDAACGAAHLTLPSLRDGPLPLPPKGRRGAFCKTFGSPLPREFHQALLRRLPLRNWLLGVFVTQLIEVEAAAIDDFAAAFDRVFPAAEQPRHLLRRFQMALGIGGKAITGFGDRAAIADAGQHIL